MKAPHWTPIAFSTALLVAFSGQANAAAYTVTDLGTLSGYISSVGNAINASGQVTGFATTAAGVQQAFIYNPGSGLAGLGTLGGASSQGWGINDAGQVTGTAATAGGVSHAFVSTGSGLVDLTPGSTASSAGYAINNQGVIAGALDGKPLKVDSAGVVSPLSLSYTAANGGTSQGSTGLAYAINAQGTVTGLANFYPATNYSLAYTADGTGTGSPLAGINGNTQSQGRGINDLGKVVGSASFNGAIHAALFSGGVVADLGSLCAGGFSGASSINNLGQVVGSSQDCGASAGNSRGFLYSNGQLTDLNTLLAPDDASAWLIQRASGINESGQITGTGLVGGQMHAFILTPVPEPATGAMMVLGLGGLCLVVRARRK